MKRGLGADLFFPYPLQWRHNERDCVSNYRLSIVYAAFVQAQNKEDIKAPRHWP